VKSLQAFRFGCACVAPRFKPAECTSLEHGPASEPVEARSVHQWRSNCTLPPEACRTRQVCASRRITQSLAASAENSFLGDFCKGHMHAKTWLNAKCTPSRMYWLRRRRCCANSLFPLDSHLSAEVLSSQRKDHCNALGSASANGSVQRSHGSAQATSTLMAS
jgi:hypothetical protein